MEDVLLRFAWTLTVTLSTVSGVHGMSDILATILAPLEVFRYVSLFVFSYNLDIFFCVTALLSFLHRNNTQMLKCDCNNSDIVIHVIHEKWIH